MITLDENAVHVDEALVNRRRDPQLQVLVEGVVLHRAFGG